MNRKQAEARLKAATGAFVQEMLAVIFDEEAPKQPRYRCQKVIDIEVPEEVQREARRILARINE